MPGWLILLALGIVLCCAAYYLPMPPPVNRVVLFFGVVCLIFGAAFGIYALIFVDGLVHVT